MFTLQKKESEYGQIIDDIGAETLRTYLNSHKYDLTDNLRISIKITEVLERFHYKGSIHGGLNPENILIQKNNEKIYITDPNNTLLFPADNESMPITNETATAFEYISPEQTGRISTGIDKRSDLYSLGIVFYEMMTGRLPFQANTAAEWIHTHLTKQPAPPDEFNSNIPSVISNIIIKLLEKDADKRYQSAYGLLQDLLECERQLINTGKVDTFIIGRNDEVNSLCLPCSLYGREAEIKALTAAYERVRQGRTEIVLISGYPGIGKTSLVVDGLKPVIFKSCHFIMGKSDQLKQNAPYAPLAMAFEYLVKQLMTQSGEELDKWNKKLQMALGRSGAVITEIIPQLERIIGKQPPVDVLPPKEAENRFLMVFAEFVKVFACKGYPLVIFIDDLQWADPACLQLIKLLARDASINNMLLIGAYRENEVSDDHPAAILTKEFYDDLTAKCNIRLKPLDIKSTGQLIADTLHDGHKNSSALSEILHQKSGGNPIFLKQLLILIHKNGLLYYDKQEGCWKWDLDGIRDMKQWEAVQELFLNRLNSLPEDTIKIMKLAACIGNSFNLDVLAAVYGKSTRETAAILNPAVIEGLVLEVKDHNEKVPMEEQHVYRFLHDWLQQTVYSLNTECEKKEIHLAIGRFLLENTNKASLDEAIMTIMDHFNRGLELICNFEDRITLAEYNLTAGRKAKASAAYTSALKYLRFGRILLPYTSWDSMYELTYDLYLELAQAEYLSANMADAEELFDIVIEKAKTEMERASIYGLKMILYAGIGEYSDAVITGIRALEKLGVKLPVQPTKLDYARELLLYKWYMMNKKIENLVYMPEIKDPKQIKIAELLSRLASVTMTSYPDLYSFIILKSGNHAVRNGNTNMSSVGYFGYSIMAGSIFGDYESGDRYGKVCIELVNKYNKSSSKCIVNFTVGAFTSHWTKHASCGLEYLRRAINFGFEAGDILIIGYAHCLLLETRCFMGVSLYEIEKETREKLKIADRLKHEALEISAEIYDKAVSALLGRKTGSLKAGIAEFDKPVFAELVQRDKASLATYYYYKLQLCYMAGEYIDALSAAQNIEPIYGSITGFMITAEYNFYYSLTITALYEGMPALEKIRLRKKLKHNQRQMKKWSESCKENYKHKYLLVEAEIARMDNDIERAMQLYDNAIHEAGMNNFIQNEALANELAARFYLSHNMNKIARVYMLDACQGYAKWGAHAKVEENLARYPELVKKQDLDKKRSSNVNISRSTKAVKLQGNETIKELDMHSLGKVMAEISSAYDENRLMEYFLETAVKIIGGEKGYLILEENGEMYVKATKESDFRSTVVNPVPLEKCHNLSRAVIWYAVRTNESVLLNCQQSTGIFARDPYINESNPKSIACLPLLLKGILIGVLYFENNYIAGAFSADQLESLRILSTQVASIKVFQDYMSNRNPEDELDRNLQMFDPLTARELEVLKLIAEGMPNKEIADRLGITLDTVIGYIKNIYGKLGASRRIQVVNRAIEFGLVERL